MISHTNTHWPKHKTEVEILARSWSRSVHAPRIANRVEACTYIETKWIRQAIPNSSASPQLLCSGRCAELRGEDSARISETPCRCTCAALCSRYATSVTQQPRMHRVLVPRVVALRAHHFNPREVKLHDAPGGPERAAHEVIIDGWVQEGS